MHCVEGNIVLASMSIVHCLVSCIDPTHGWPYQQFAQNVTLVDKHLPINKVMTYSGH